MPQDIPTKTRPPFYILPFLADAVGIAYLGYRQPFEAQREANMALIIRATDKWHKDEGMWYAEPREIGKELQWFYNQALIDLGMHSRYAKVDELRYDNEFHLNGDNHDGLVFDVDGLGTFMLVHTDGSWLLFMTRSAYSRASGSKVAATDRNALAYLKVMAL